MSEITFKDSLSLSILTITNTVNSINYNLNNFNFLNLNILSKTSLILFMVIGRVELEKDGVVKIETIK